MQYYIYESIGIRDLLSSRYPTHTAMDRTLAWTAKEIDKNSSDGIVELMGISEYSTLSLDQPISKLM